LSPPRGPPAFVRPLFRRPFPRFPPPPPPPFCGPVPFVFLFGGRAGAPPCFPLTNRGTTAPTTPWAAPGRRPAPLASVVFFLCFCLDLVLVPPVVRAPLHPLPPRSPPPPPPPPPPPSRLPAFPGGSTTPPLPGTSVRAAHPSYFSSRAYTLSPFTNWFFPPFSLPGWSPPVGPPRFTPPPPLSCPPPPPPRGKMLSAPPWGKNAKGRVGPVGLWVGGLGVVPPWVGCVVFPYLLWPLVPPSPCPSSPPPNVPPVLWAPHAPHTPIPRPWGGNPPSPFPPWLGAPDGRGPVPVSNLGPPAWQTGVCLGGSCTGRGRVDLPPLPGHKIRVPPPPPPIAPTAPFVGPAPGVKTGSLYYCGPPGNPSAPRFPFFPPHFVFGFGPEKNSKHPPCPFSGPPPPPRWHPPELPGGAPPQWAGWGGCEKTPLKLKTGCPWGGKPGGGPPHHPPPGPPRTAGPPPPFFFLALAWLLFPRVAGGLGGGLPLSPLFGGSGGGGGGSGVVGGIVYRPRCPPPIR